MTINSNTPVGEVVKMNLNTAPVFQANHIDYCCGGSKSISEACSDAGIEPAELIDQLEKITEKTDPDSEFFNSLPLDDLCDYIVKRHHQYVKSNIPFLKASLDKICDVHGENHPELFDLRKLFNGSAGDLTMHMQKEEIMLFPYIAKMAKSEKEGSEISSSVFGSVENPIRMMISEHDTEGRRFDSIAGISNNYEIPGDACMTYKATILRLKDFENDLHRHIHLENNILFPKAIELESQVMHKSN